MANWCFNYAIITHEDKTKVSDLYRITSGDFFNFILPTPVDLEFYSSNLPLDKEYYIDEFGSDNMRSWRIENWGNPSPPILGWCERTISEKGDYVTLEFDTKSFPALGIYQELEIQGYYIKSYYWEPYACICGSYIYGVHDHCSYLNDEQDIPPDVDYIMGVQKNKYWCGKCESNEKRFVQNN